MLEHVTPDQGAAYLEIALRRAPQLEGMLDRFRANDRVGAPVVSAFGEHGDFSPTTLRYVKVLADLLSLFDSLDGLDVIEIGAGYGGQAVVCSLAGSFASYTLVDLPEPAALQRKYVDRVGVEQVRTLTADMLDDRRYDLVLSNYAFSELTRPTQRRYLDRVLQRSARGYLTLNHHTPRAYRSFTTRELLARLPGSRVLPVEHESFLDRRAGVDLLVWGDEDPHGTFTAP